MATGSSSAFASSTGPVKREHLAATLLSISTWALRSLCFGGEDHNLELLFSALDNLRNSLAALINFSGFVDRKRAANCVLWGFTPQPPASCVDSGTELAQLIESLSFPWRGVCRNVVAVKLIEGVAEDDASLAGGACMPGSGGPERLPLQLPEAELLATVSRLPSL